MKITICGSVTFAKEELMLKSDLEKIGHNVLVTDDLEKFANNPEIKLNYKEELRLTKESNTIRKFFKKIEESEAILVANYEKNEIAGYLGTNVLMEIGLAYYLDKKIFLLNPVGRDQNCSLEIASMDPIIINNDLSKIK